MSSLYTNYNTHYARTAGHSYDAGLRKATAEDQRLLHLRALSAANAQNDSAVLDIGCGVGELLDWLRRQGFKRAAGVDISAQQVEIARRYVAGAELNVGSASEFLLGKKECYRVIFCNDVLEHMSSVSEAIDLVKKIHGALEFGGVLFARVPNAANLFGTYSRYIDLTHHLGFTSHSFRQLLDTAAFQSATFHPYLPERYTGKIRAGLEFAVHWALFKLTGRGNEAIFSSNIHAICVK